MSIMNKQDAKKQSTASLISADQNVALRINAMAAERLSQIGSKGAGD